MSSRYSKLVMIDGESYLASVAARPDGNFTASVFAGGVNNEASDDSRPARWLRRALRRFARRTDAPESRLLGSSIVPSFWKAIKQAEDMLSGRAQRRIWLGSEDDIEWIRGYCADKNAEFIDPGTPVDFCDSRVRSVRRILLIGGQYVIEVAPGECWLGEMNKEGKISSWGNYGAFFAAIEGR
jgi:hypothetical protein